MVVIIFLFFILCCDKHDTPQTEAFEYSGFVFDVPIDWTKIEKNNSDGSFQATWQTIDAEFSIWLNQEAEQLESGEDYIIKINGQEITAKRIINGYEEFYFETIKFYFEGFKIIVSFINSSALNYWVMDCLQNVVKK